MKRIVLTGGGTAGHVSPNQALIPHLLDEGWDIHYIGTKKGIERSLIEPMQGVTYHASAPASCAAISTGRISPILSASSQVRSRASGSSAS